MPLNVIEGLQFRFADIPEDAVFQKLCLVPRKQAFSARGYMIDQLAALFKIDRDCVSQWFDWWDEHQFDGLDDDPRHLTLSPNGRATDTAGFA
ncbi:MAG: helix-turn-helix domain-containing protein [Blastocatellia bacterium]